MTVNRKSILSNIIVPVLLLCLFASKAHPEEATGDTDVTHSISIEFNLQKNSFQGRSRIRLPAGSKLGLELSGLDVSSITVNGRAQEHASTINHLYVSRSTEDQEVELVYGREITPGSASNNLITEKGITLIENWYPTSDQEMLFKLTAFIPNGFEAVSEAEQIKVQLVEGRKQIDFLFPHPLFAINFIAGPYEVKAERFGNEKDLVAYFFPEDRELAAEYLKKARAYLERYEELLGPYPYSRFSIVENRLPTGFAMPTFTLLGQAVVRLPFIVDTSLGHEVLHSWFGNGVRMNPQESNWVEGLTTYLADHAFAAEKGRGVQYRKEQLVKYHSYVKPDMDLRLRYFKNIGDHNTKDKATRAVGYNKSSMFFHMLRYKVGHEVFISSLQDFYSRLKHKMGGWSDLLVSFENISGLDLEGFFWQWLDGNDTPDISIRNISVKNHEGFPVLRFDLVQNNNKPYEMELPIIIRTSTDDVLFNLIVRDSPSTFNIHLTSVPEMLIIDPEYDVMRTLDTLEMPATWSQFLGSEHKTVVLPSEEYRIRFKPLLEQIADKDTHILLQDEANDNDINGHTLLFLGPESSVSRSLFAQTHHPAEGFTLDVRKSPLNEGLVAALVSADDEEQVKKATAKLRHYGKYSYLFFKDGKIEDKMIQETESGLKVDLVRLPPGMETSKTKDFDDIIAKLLHYQVIYVGEVHTNYEDHMLQLEIIRALHEHDPDLAIGMEMFTRQTQPALDRYIRGETDEKTFLKESHYFNIWRFDYRYYRDIINFARHNKLQILGLNLEKDIVSHVFKSGGTGTLPEEDIDSLPTNRKLDMPGYRERVKGAFLMHSSPEQQLGDFSGFIQAQALWDETMAETITEYLESNPNSRVVVIAGRGHTDKINAIPPRVSRRLHVSQAVVVNNTSRNSESETADFIFFSQPATLSPFPLLGVMLEDTENEDGVLVTATSKMGHAKKAGIEKDDVILAIDSEPVNDIEDVKIAMLYKEDSETVTVKILRQKFLGKNIIDIEVNLKNRPSPHN
jgi:uncharacterized iron-regulated protein